MIELLIGILATWRIAAYLFHDGEARWVEWMDGHFEFMSCFWCVTLRVGIVLTPLVIWFWYPLIPFALSGGAMLLSQAGRIIWHDMVDTKKEVVND